MNAVLALNSGKNEFGDLTRETQDRADAAMLYAIKHAIEIVIMVGGDADSMCSYAVEHFPEGPIPIAENKSMDTVEGAHVTKLSLLQPNDWGEVDVFTNDFHAPRAEWSYFKVLGNAFSITMHSVETNYLSPRKSELIRRREHVQLSIAKLKLLGIGPDDDARRERRLSHFRFRGRESALARLAVKLDNMTNVSRN